MKINYRFIKLLLCLLIPFFASCVEELEIDTDGIERKIVINGVVATSPDRTQVYLSLSSNAFKDESIQKVSGAVVAITDNEGGGETLYEKEKGLYKAAALSGIPGKTYTLKVEFGGKIYTAASTMPEVVNVDSIKTEYKSQSSGFNLNFPFVFTFYSYDLKFYLKNRMGVEEYCVMKLVNDKTKKTQLTILFSDKYSDGKQNIIEKRGISLDSGTGYTLEVFSVDKAVYNYLYQLDEKKDEWSSDILELFNNTSFNPKSNFNDALGYFMASSVKSYPVKLSSPK